MANVENEELRASLCNICDWRSSSCEDQSPSSVNNLEKRKVALLARASREKLPSKYRHVICKPQPNECTEPDVCVLRTNCKSKEEVDSWISMYSDHSGFKWDLQPRPASFNGKVKELHRCKYVCHELIFGQTISDKKTAVQQCPASIAVVIKSGKIGETDEHINSFPTVVRLRGDHSCHTGRSLKGDINCNSSRQRQESEIQIKTLSLKKEGKSEVKAEIKAKKDPHIAVRNPITLTVGNASHNAKKAVESSAKMEPIIISRNIIDIAVTTKVEAENPDVKVATNSSLIFSKENTSQELVKGSTKETLAKKVFDSAAKAKSILGKVNGHSHKQVDKEAKKPLILKANRISAPIKITKAGNMKAEDHTEGKPTTMLVKDYQNPEEKTAAAVMKVAIPAATKRKHEDTNGPSTKSKKARVEERKSCVKYLCRNEPGKKTSPKKTLYEEKAIPVAHTMECMPQAAEEAKTLKVYRPTQSLVKTVTAEPERCQQVDQIDKFAGLYPKFDALFAQNHEPATALVTHIVDVQLREGSNWRNVACPDIDWCQSRFNKVIREPLIATPQTTFTALTELAACCGAADVCRVDPVDGGGFVAVIVTALMKRNAETNPAAAGINYVLPYLGSTSHLYLVMCDSEGGGLPLAMIITSDVTPTVMGPAVRLLASLSPLSPRQWLVPDVPALSAALVEQFPCARVNLALSLLLKEAWLFAFRTSNRVPESYQVLLYQYVVHMIGCPTDLDLVYQLQVALRSGDKSYVGFLNELHRRRAEWAVYLRDVPHRESALATEIAVAKASVFARLHDFDTVHRVHFALTRLDKWYEHRILAVQSGTHVDLPITLATMPPGMKVTALSEGIKLVQGEREAEELIVNDNVGGCSCLRGKPGWCRHQLAVSLAGKVDQLPSTFDVLRLVPQDCKQSVQVDLSRPEIFPAGITSESPKLSMWGPPEVQGKRVRKVPTKLKVDLGVIACKKPKVEKKAKDAQDFLEGHGRLTEDAVRVEVVEKKSKPKQAGKNKIVKRRSKNRASVPGKDFGNVLPVTAEEEKGELDCLRDWLTNEGLPAKKSRSHLSSDSSSSQTKAVHFSPLVDEKTLSGPKQNIFKLIKIIRRDLPQCYTRNPGLKEKICEFYRAMTAPVVEPKSILKRTLEIETLPIETPITVASVKDPIKVPSVATSTTVPPVEISISVPPEKMNDDVPFAGFDDTCANFDLTFMEYVVGVVNMEEVVEETVPAGITVNPCVVLLAKLDLENYKKADGSYSSVIIRDTDF